MSYDGFLTTGASLVPSSRIRGWLCVRRVSRLLYINWSMKDHLPNYQLPRRSREYFIMMMDQKTRYRALSCKFLERLNISNSLYPLNHPCCLYSVSIIWLCGFLRCLTSSTISHHNIALFIAGDSLTAAFTTRDPSDIEKMTSLSPTDVLITQCSYCSFQ